MNRLKEVKELKALAEELQLENREIIRKYKITELASIYNGIGPDSFPEWLRGLVSALHPSLALSWPLSTTSSGMSQTDRKRNSPNPTTASKPTATRWRKPITAGGIRSATSS